LESSSFFWANHSFQAPISLFLAQLGRSYITTCFIPIHLGMRVLFYDQTYYAVRNGFTLNVTVDESLGTFEMGSIDETRRYEGTAVLIGGSPEDAWFHWTLNWCPRLALVKYLCPEIFEDSTVRFVFHTNVQNQPYRSMLDLFGIEEHRILYIDPHQGALFENL